MLKLILCADPLTPPVTGKNTRSSSCHYSLAVYKITVIPMDTDMEKIGELREHFKTEMCYILVKNSERKLCKHFTTVKFSISEQSCFSPSSKFDWIDVSFVNGQRVMVAQILWGIFGSRGLTKTQNNDIASIRYCKSVETRMI